MRIYKVIVGEDRFEYSYITDKISLPEFNKGVSGYPLLGSNDINLVGHGGGTVVFIANNNWGYAEVDKLSDGDHVYVIDIDFVLNMKGYKVFDNSLYDKFESIRKSVKRDM
jgi:hypothetical protein